jgi:hypothetical protein
VLVGQPAGAIAGARGDLAMGAFTAPVVGNVATWMARLPLPRFIVRMGLRPTVRADTARSLSDDTVDGARPSRRAIARNESPAAIPREISSRSAGVTCSRDRFGSIGPGRRIARTARLIA